MRSVASSDSHAATGSRNSTRAAITHEHEKALHEHASVNAVAAGVAA